VKDKDREMAKAINAEFSDDEDEEDDNKSNWDEEEKVYDNMFHISFAYLIHNIILLRFHNFYNLILYSRMIATKRRK